MVSISRLTYFQQNLFSHKDKSGLLFKDIDVQECLQSNNYELHSFKNLALPARALLFVLKVSLCCMYAFPLSALSGLSVCICQQSIQIISALGNQA